LRGKQARGDKQRDGAQKPAAHPARASHQRGDVGLRLKMSVAVSP